MSGTLTSAQGPYLSAGHSPSCVEASTTLHGMFLRCPMMTSSTKDLSPSSSTARTAGHKYFRTRWPTLGLTELFPSFACRCSREWQGVIWRQPWPFLCRPAWLAPAPPTPQNPALEQGEVVAHGGRGLQGRAQSSTFLLTFTPGSRLVPKWATMRSTAVLTALIRPASKD